MCVFSRSLQLHCFFPSFVSFLLSFISLLTCPPPSLLRSLRTKLTIHLQQSLILSPFLFFFHLFSLHCPSSSIGRFFPFSLFIRFLSVTTADIFVLLLIPLLYCVDALFYCSIGTLFLVLVLYLFFFFSFFLASSHFDNVVTTSVTLIQ